MAGASQVKAGEAFVKLTVQGQGSFTAAMAAARAKVAAVGTSATSVGSKMASASGVFGRVRTSLAGVSGFATKAAHSLSRMSIPTFGAIRGIAVQFAVAAAPLALLVRRAFQLNDSLRNIPTNVIGTLKDEFDGVARTLGDMFGPELKEFSQQLRGLVVTVGEAGRTVVAWAAAHKDAAAGIGAVLGVVGAIGSVLISVAGVMGLFKVAMIPIVSIMSGIGTAIGALSAPVLLTIGAVVALIAAFVKWTDTGKKVVSDLIGLWLQKFNLFVNIIGGMKDALVGGDWETAGKIAYLGIQAGFIEPLRAAWEASIAWLKETWAGFTSVLVGAFVSAAEAIINAWEKASTFVSTKVLDLIGQSSLLSKAFEKVTGATVEDTKAGVKQAAKDDLAGIRQALADVRKAEEGGLAAAVADRTATADAAAARAAELQAELQRLREKAKTSRESRTSGLSESATSAAKSIKSAGTFSGFRLESQFGVGVDPAFALAQQQLATEKQALAVGKEQLRASNEIVGAVKGIKFAWGA